MSQSLRHPRVVMMLLGSLGLVSLLVWSVMLSVSPSAAYADGEGALTATELESILIRAGLDPETLAATGVSANTAGQVAAAAAEEAASSLASIRSAEESFAAADNAYHAALRMERRHPGSVEGLSALEQSLSSAATARAAAIAAVTGAGLDVLPSEQRLIATTIGANRRFGAGTSLSAADRTEAQWVALRDALAHERIQTKRGLEVDGDVASLLSAARGVAAVSSAQASLTTNLSAVRAAWTAAVASELGG
jgi:hypothetical protein